MTPSTPSSSAWVRPPTTPSATSGRTSSRYSALRSSQRAVVRARAAHASSDECSERLRDGGEDRAPRPEARNGDPVLLPRESRVDLLDVQLGNDVAVGQTAVDRGGTPVVGGQR